MYVFIFRYYTSLDLHNIIIFDLSIENFSEVRNSENKENPLTIICLCKLSCSVALIIVDVMVNTKYYLLDYIIV